MSHTRGLPSYTTHNEGPTPRAARSSPMYLDAISLTYEIRPEQDVEVNIILRKKDTEDDIVLIKRTIHWHKEPSLHYPLSLEPPYSVDEGDLLSVHVRARRFLLFSKTRTTAAIMCSLVQLQSKEKKTTDSIDDGIVITDHNFNPQIKVYLCQRELSSVVHEATYDVMDNAMAVVDRLKTSTRFLDIVLISTGSLDNLKNLDLGVMNPFVKAFIFSITQIVQGFEKQQANHQDLVDLAERIAYSVDLVLDIDQFASVGQLKSALIMGARLFEETSNFILRFTQMSSFEHIRDAIISSQNRQEIDRLTKRFTQFAEKFDRGLAVQTAVVTQEINTKANEIDHNVRELSDKFDAFMRQMASPETEKTLKRLIISSVNYGIPGDCLQGSQLGLLNNIMAWIDDMDSTSNVLILPENSDADGSVIASTLVQGLSSSQRLGSFFFFDKDSPQKTTTACVQKIVYDLAEQHMIVKDEALRLLQDNMRFLETSGAVRIYEALVHDPLSKLDRETMPRGKYPLIIIGRAHECGTQRAGDKAALQTIIERWCSLPSSFKLIISGQIGSGLSANVPTSGFQPLVIDIPEELRYAPTATYQREYARITRYFVDRDISDEPLDPALQGSICCSEIVKHFHIDLPSYEPQGDIGSSESSTAERSLSQDVTDNALSTAYEGGSTSPQDPNSRTIYADLSKSRDLPSEHTDDIADGADNRISGSGEDIDNESDSSPYPSPITPVDFRNNRAFIASPASDEDEAYRIYSTMSGRFSDPEMIGADDYEVGSYFHEGGKMVISTGRVISYVRQRGLSLHQQS